MSESLNEFIEFTAKVKDFVAKIEAQKSVVSLAGQTLKKLREDLETTIKLFRQDDAENFPLLHINRGEVDEADESWKALLAKDHFKFSETELTLLGDAIGVVGVDFTVGELAELREKMSTRGLKIKGFGQAKIQKLDDQFIEFWESQPKRIKTEETDEQDED